VDNRVDIEWVRLLLKLVASLKIDVLPGDRANFFGSLRTLCIPGSVLVLQEPREDRGVAKDDAVGDQPAAFRPKLLLILGFEAELAEA
jgi:hypothetical protein